MTHRGPVVTAVVVVAGLVGFMTANSAGALVATKSADQNPGVEVPAPQNPPEEANKPPQQGEEKPPAEKPPAEKPQKPEKPEAPPAPTFPAEAMYSGDATGSDLAIAVAVKGEQASAYLCDGAAVEEWLKGSVDAGKVELTSKNGETALSAGLDGKRLAGEVTFRGKTLPFSIAIAPPPAGLYRGENGETTVGWIIMPNGQQVGISSTAGAERPAPALDPDKGFVTVDGNRVDAQQVEGDTTW